MRRLTLGCMVLMLASCRCGGVPGAYGDVLASYCKFIDRCPNSLPFPITYRSTAECVDILNFTTTCRLDAKEGPSGDAIVQVQQVTPNVDPAAAAACRAFLESASCDTSLTACDSSTDAGCNPCSRVFSEAANARPDSGGGARIDEACTDNSSCAAGLYCLNAKTIPDAGTTCRVCKPLRPIGGDCIDPPHVPCDSTTSYCDYANGSCAALAAAGAACSSTTAPCLSGFCNPNSHVCDNGGKKGDPCTVTSDCRGGFCNTSAGVCAEKKVNGLACASNSECLTNVCDSTNNKCGKPNGAACLYAGECQEVCDTTAKLCKPAYANGVQCTSNEQCQSKLCHQADRVCRPACGAGCATGEFCDTYGACRTLLATGSQCDAPSECQTGWCNSSGRCGKKAALGDTCSTYADCLPAGYCASGTCQAFVKPGGACQALDSCAPPFFCTKGTCTLMNLECKPASAGSQCTFLQVCDEKSYCDLFNNFTCAPRKALGSGCLRTGDCTNDGYCYQRVCTARAKSGTRCDQGQVCEDGLFCDETVTPAVCSGPKPPGAKCSNASDCDTGACEYSSGSGRTCQAACLSVPTGDQPACHPTRCSDFGFNCGTIDGGCGEPVYCGQCNMAYQTCGGGGQPQVCGCTPTRTCQPGECNATFNDGCGKQVTCNSDCGDAGRTCGGGTPNVCSCSTDRSAGPSFAAMAANVAASPSDAGVAWALVGSLSAEDDAGAHVRLVAGSTATVRSQYLMATGFGFNLPPTASVNGITVKMRRYSLPNVSSGEVAVFSGGKKLGTLADNYWTTAWGTEQVGGATNVFGHPFTPEEINSPDFSVGILVSASNKAFDVSLDTLQVTVTYAYRCDCKYTCKSNSECGSDGCGGTCGAPGTTCGDGGSCTNGFCHPAVFVDPNTGLMWHNTNYDAADCSSISGIKVGGYTDWRAPTINELRSRIVGCPSTQLGGQCPVSTSCTDAGTCLDAGCDGCPYRQGPDPYGCYLDNHTEWISCTGGIQFYSTTKSGTVPYTVDFATGRVALGTGTPRYRCVRP